MARKKTKKKAKFNKRFYRLIFCIFALLFVICLFFLLRWAIDSYHAKKLGEQLVELQRKHVQEIEPTADPEMETIPSDYWKYMKVPFVSVDFTELLKINPETVGWINVPDTNINYPIVQTNNNEYYLKHAFDRSRNSAGWIFADYRNNMKNFDFNTIVYGHGRIDTTMFGTLKKALKKEWYTKDSNLTIRLSTPTENTVWRVFSVYSTKAESYYLTTDFYGDTDSQQKYIDEMLRRSITDFQTPVTINDHILTLSTCQDNYDNRVVVMAKLVNRMKR